jgi:hypothetical protein
MRSTGEERPQEKLKSKGRQRMRPKMGKMDIDYSVLHDAFFKYQDKPNMTPIGDLYYEGASHLLVLEALGVLLCCEQSFAFTRHLRGVSICFTLGRKPWYFVAGGRHPRTSRTQ